MDPFTATADEVQLALAGQIIIEVHGVPQPQGSKTAFVRGGRAVVVEGRNATSRDNFKSWREGIAHAAAAWIDAHKMPAPLDGPVSVTIAFFMPRPKSAPKRVLLPATRPDIDKLARAVLDGITGTLIVDDARVCELRVRKVFAVERPPGCTITVEKLIL